MGKTLLISIHFQETEDIMQDLILENSSKLYSWQSMLHDLEDTTSYLNEKLYRKDINSLKRESQELKKRKTILKEELNKTKEDFKNLCNIASRNNIRMLQSILLPNVIFGNNTVSDTQFRNYFTQISQAICNQDNELRLIESEQEKNIQWSKIP